MMNQRYLQRKANMAIKANMAAKACICSFDPKALVVSAFKFVP